jgi:hypothetical protein
MSEKNKLRGVGAEPLRRPLFESMRLTEAIDQPVSFGFHESNPSVMEARSSLTSGSGKGVKFALPAEMWEELQTLHIEDQYSILSSYFEFLQLHCETQLRKLWRDQRG